MRTLRRQDAESQQLGLALGMDEAEGLVFCLAIETGVTGGVERIVFLALRAEEGKAERVWPIPLGVSVEQSKPGIQLQLIEDDGYARPISRPPSRGAVGYDQTRRRQLRAI